MALGEWSPSFKHEDGMAIVVDPATRKMQVPLAALTATRAVHRQGIPSLCLLFIAGRCRQGSQCHQVHCDRSVVEVLRTASAAIPTCCLAHGDINANRMHPTWLEREFILQGVRIPLRQMGYTKGIDRVMTEHLQQRGAASTDPIAIDMVLVCRQHGTSSCRYSEDCKFLHPCQKIVTQQLAPWMIQQDRPPPLHQQQQPQPQLPVVHQMQMFPPMLQQMAPIGGGPMPMHMQMQQQPQYFQMMPQQMAPMMVPSMPSPYHSPMGSLTLIQTPPTMQQQQQQPAMMLPMLQHQQMQYQYVLVPPMDQSNSQQLMGQPFCGQPQVVVGPQMFPPQQQQQAMYWQTSGSQFGYSSSQGPPSHGQLSMPVSDAFVAS